MKCITITLILLWHLDMRDTQYTIIHWMSCFRMPMFFLCAGFLTKKAKMTGPIGGILSDGFKKYICPYFIFTALYLLNYAAYYLIFHKQKTLDQIDLILVEAAWGYIVPLWFLITMFSVRVYSWALLKFVGRAWVLPLAFAISMAFAATKFKPLPHDFLGLGKAGIILVFYILGYYLNSKKVLDSLKRINKTAAFAVFVVACAISYFLYYAYVCDGAVSVSVRAFDLGENTFMFYVTSLIAMVGVFCFSYLLPKSRIAVWISKNTIIIFGMHIVFFSYFSNFETIVFKGRSLEEYRGFLNALYIAGAMVLSVPTKFVLHKIFPKIFP